MLTFIVALAIAVFPVAAHEEWAKLTNRTRRHALKLVAVHNASGEIEPMKNHDAKVLQPGQSAKWPMNGRTGGSAWEIFHVDDSIYAQRDYAQNSAAGFRTHAVGKSTNRYLNLGHTFPFMGEDKSLAFVSNKPEAFKAWDDTDNGREHKADHGDFTTWDKVEWGNGAYTRGNEWRWAMNISEHKNCVRKNNNHGHGRGCYFGICESDEAFKEPWKKAATW